MALFLPLISQDALYLVSLQKALTLSPQVCSIVLLVILTGFLKHLINATIFQSILFRDQKCLAE